ncbi:hypothetical protein NCAS_0C05230 [Naumovozyma castellii]|uniref:PH-response regulator protein palI/RIM9 n=1 Tax=Naumovozyma castellii TaxID=27288 RepID=G0VDF1_NAUCA|nr:hypothetical protein NCAS_0C05230 [Naumovozyma castellii CBS 4309]CCC69513.1 hypothetical protein NCAS_0C05230 [Naumovozyma castellii CBS 4309]
MRWLNIRSIVAFLLTVIVVFQIFPVISIPITNSIILSSHEGLSYGVFGWCVTEPGMEPQCTRTKIGYDSSDPAILGHSLFLPSSSKYSVTKLLVVHPIALTLTVILWAMSLIITLSRMGTSPSFILLTACVSLLAFLFSLFCFLVDLLLFKLALRWPGWLMFASTVLIAVCCSLLWSLRRTVSIQKYESLRMGSEEEGNRSNSIITRVSSKKDKINVESYEMSNMDRLSSMAASANLSYIEPQLAYKGSIV